tara:strand:+ start:64 stop:312 length:249 start_codon:yes stop_codon:yes gene_type:complete
MHKNKSYMNKNNILSEGVLDTLIKFLTQYPKLKKSKEFQNGMKDLNKGQQKLEDLMNAEIKNLGIKRKPIKLQKFKTSDFFK